MFQRLAMLIGVVLPLTVVLTGCGGGDDALSDTTTLEGVIYRAVESATAAVDTTQAGDPGPGYEPAPDRPVTCVREGDGKMLGRTRTDAQGRYRFEGLPRGEGVEVICDLGDGEMVRERVRLRDRVQQHTMLGPGPGGPNQDAGN